MELPKAIGKLDHRVAFEKSPKRMRVLVKDTTIADTVGPGLLFETGYRPVYYFPRIDVRMDLARTHRAPHALPLQGRCLLLDDKSWRPPDRKRGLEL